MPSAASPLASARDALRVAHAAIEHAANLCNAARMPTAANFAMRGDHHVLEALDMVSDRIRETDYSMSLPRRGVAEPCSVGSPSRSLTPAWVNGRWTWSAGHRLEVSR